MNIHENGRQVKTTGIGGEAKKIYYGPNWSRQRRKARERDGYQCRHCGMTDEKHKEEYGRELHVHHIERFNDFDLGDPFHDYPGANDLDNLVTLCRGCHDRFEGKYPELSVEEWLFRIRQDSQQQIAPAVA